MPNNSHFTPEQIQEILDLYFENFAHRQYIGARYVPIFGRKDEESIEWDNTGTYEPLTIVLYNGNSFTSRQFVPIGVEITNNEYWAETGNYNAQIEQYRQEVSHNTETVNSYVEAVDTLREDFDKTLSHLKIHVLGVAGVVVGSCYIVEYENKFVCIDCGDSSAEIYVRDFCTNILGNKKFSAVICTHFHHDHDSQASVIAEFCDIDTDVFIQMEPSSGNDEYTIYQERKADFISVFPNATTPINNSVRSYGNMNVRIFNTDPLNRTLYDSTPANKSAYPLTEESGINNYSLIVEIKTPNGSYLNTGDIEGVAEEMNASLVKPVEVCHNPHHTSNFNGYLNFFLNAQPILFETTLESQSPSSVIRRWTMCLLKYMNRNICINGNTTYTIDVFNGRVFHSNYNEISYYSPKSTSNYTYYGMVSALYYNRDPWAIFRMTANQLMVNIVNTRSEEGCYLLSTSSTGNANDQGASNYFFSSLIELFKEQLGLATENGRITTVAQIGFTIDKLGSVKIYRVNSASNTGIVEVNCCYSSSATNNLNIYSNYIESNFLYTESEVNYTNNPESMVISNQTAINMLRSTNEIIVVSVDSSDNAFNIPMLRMGTALNRNNNYFRGTMFRPSTQEIYYATMDNATLTITAAKYNLTNGTTTQLHIYGYQIV